MITRLLVASGHDWQGAREFRAHALIKRGALLTHTAQADDGRRLGRRAEIHADDDAPDYIKVVLLASTFTYRPAAQRLVSAPNIILITFNMLESYWLALLADGAAFIAMSIALAAACASRGPRRRR